MLWGFKVERNRVLLVHYHSDSGGLPACTSCEVETQTLSLDRVVEGKLVILALPPFLVLLQEFVFFFFPHLNRQSNPTSYSLNHLTFLLGKRKRRKKDLKDWESLILGMELKQVGQKPLEPARCCLLAVWFQFEEVPLQGARCFPLKLCFLPRHFVKATPQAALVDLLNVSKHLLSLL